jgi:hypothetical protein
MDIIKKHILGIVYRVEPIWEYIIQDNYAKNTIVKTRI